MPADSEEGGFFRETEEPALVGAQPLIEGVSVAPPATTSSHLVTYDEGCSNCSSVTINQEWRQVFGVLLCNSCKLNDPLISKSAAKKEFVLSDRDLVSLGSLKKRNPQHPDWQPMLLYLKSQVAQVSRNLHGSVESAQEAKRVRDQERLEQKIKGRAEAHLVEERRERHLGNIKKRILETDRGIAGAPLSSSDVEEL